MKTGPADLETVVDIGEIPAMHGIEDDGDVASIGTLTIYATVADTVDLWQDATVFSEAAGEIGDTQVRNRGAVGDNLVHSGPAPDLPAATIAADATFVAEGQDSERRIGAEDFFVGMYIPDLAGDELLTVSRYPEWPRQAVRTSRSRVPPRDTH